MFTLKRPLTLALCGAGILLLGCGKSDDTSAESADAAGLSPADVAGTWNARAVPFSGDTTPTTFTLIATNSTDGWTLTYPNRPPLSTGVTFDGDSVITDTGPYESVRRKGVQVRVNGAFRLQPDGTLAGTSLARYATKGVDSVQRFRVTASRAP
ncbi:MAG: hypothetical protein WD802_04880 [Gemmatimonadaceae bacterium]